MKMIGNVEVPQSAFMAVLKPGLISSRGYTPLARVRCVICLLRKRSAQIGFDDPLRYRPVTGHGTNGVIQSTQEYSFSFIGVTPPLPCPLRGSRLLRKRSAQIGFDDSLRPGP